MERKKYQFPGVGMRNLKTAFGVTLCALVYLLAGRNPTFACIGVVFGLGNSMENSILHGGNRFFGTVIGGFLGMGLFSIYTFFYPDGRHRVMLLPLLFVGVVLMIVCCQLFHWPGAVQPGGVMLCILLFNTPVTHYVTYSLNRILDTGIGVLTALAINLHLTRERVAFLDRKLRPGRRQRLLADCPAPPEEEQVLSGRNADAGPRG